MIEMPSNLNFHPSRTYQCLECGTTVTMPKGMNPSMTVVITPDGPVPAGCRNCGSFEYRPILDQLPPE